MGPDPDTDVPDRTWLLRAFAVLWLLLPALAQVFLLVGAVTGGSGLATVVWVLAVVAIGFVGRHEGRRENPPGWGPRYGPVVAFIAVLWILWVLDMVLSGSDFTRSGLHPSLYLVYLPWIGVGLVSASTGSKWLLLFIPTVVYAVYGAELWRASPERPSADRRPWLFAGTGLAALGLLVAWQVQQGLGALVPRAIKGEALYEEVNLNHYRPFEPGNRLVAVEPVRGQRFEGQGAPRLDGATAAYPVYAAMAQAFYTPEAARESVRVSRTPAAYERLIKGQVDAIFVAQASGEQQRMAREQGVTLHFTPIAREAFVFLVSEANPVRSLSSAQIRDIYSGRIQQWDEVGGGRALIVPFQRPGNSGSQTVMLSRVMQGQAMRKPLHEEVAQAMGGMLRNVAAYRNAPQSLGYSFRYYTIGMQHAQAVRLLAVDGVEPAVANVRSGAYPYTVDLFMVTTDKSRPATAEIREWLLGPQGQKLVEDVGYVRR